MYRYAFIADGTIERTSLRLQSGFLFLIHAGCTNIVRWLTVANIWLQSISKRTSREHLKTVAVNLTFPIFNLSQFFFKLGYLCGERRLFLLTGERDSGDSHKLYVHLRDCGNKLAVIGKTVRGLRKIKGYFGAGHSGGNFGKHEASPNV